MGHDVTLYGAAGSVSGHPKCQVKYVPGGRGTIDAHEYEAYEWYWDEVMAHDWVIDCQHTHMFAEIAGWYHRDLQKKILVVPNGVATEYPRCGPYNVVAGSRKWRELMLYGRSQFAGCPPFDTRYGDSIPAMDEQDFAGVVHWATNCNLYTPGEYPREGYLLYVGRCTPYKGLNRALEVAGLSKSRLVVVPAMGMAEHRKDFMAHLPLIEEARKLGAQIDIMELPMDSRHHTAKRELYRRAKALINPVLANEPFGLITIEAMACGTPVIGSYMGALPEIITNGKNGFVCRSTEEMVDALSEIDKLDPAFIREDSVQKWHYLRAAREYLALMGEPSLR